MTETSLLPDVSGADSSYVPAPGDVDEAEGAADRRRLLMLGGAAGVIVVGAAAYFLLFHKGSSDTTTLIPVHHVIPATASHKAGAGAAASKGGGKGSGNPTKLPATSKKASAGRNPFTPLVLAPVIGGSDAGNVSVTGNPATTTSTPTGTAPITGTAPTGTTSTTTPVVTQPTTPSQGGAPKSGTTGSPTYIELLSTHGDSTATFRVGYSGNKFRKFTVKAPSAFSSSGTVFDKEFSLIGLQSGSATVQVGDGTPIDMGFNQAYPV